MLDKLKAQIKKRFKPDFYVVFGADGTLRFDIREDWIDDFLDMGRIKSTIFADIACYEVTKNFSVTDKSFRMLGLNQIHFKEGDLIMEANDYWGK